MAKTEAAHTEFRDDRFVAAFDRGQGDDRDVTVAYVVRAVTPGVYAHPAATRRGHVPAADFRPAPRPA